MDRYFRSRDCCEDQSIFVKKQRGVFLGYTLGRSIKIILHHQADIFLAGFLSISKAVWVRKEFFYQHPKATRWRAKQPQQRRKPPSLKVDKKQIKHVEGMIEVHCSWKWNLYGNLVLNVENDVNVMVYLLLVGCMFDGIKSEMLGPCGYLVAWVAYLQQLPQNPWNNHWSGKVEDGWNMLKPPGVSSTKLSSMTWCLQSCGFLQDGSIPLFP